MRTDELIAQDLLALDHELWLFTNRVAVAVLSGSVRALTAFGPSGGAGRARLRR